MAKQKENTEAIPENVPDLTKTEIGYKSINEIIKDLSKPIPQRFLEKKTKGNKDIFFISWHNATKLLDHYASGWQFEVKEIHHTAGKIVYTVRLGIPCLEGMVWREATGNEQDTLDSYGDAFVNSESQALRRAAAKFGLGRELYPTNHISDADYRKLYPNLAKEPKPPNTNPPSNPAPKPETFKQETPNAEPAPVFDEETGVAISDEQLKTLIGLCEKPPKRKTPCDKNAVAKKFSNGRTELLEDLTATEAVAAMDFIRALTGEPTK